MNSTNEIKIDRRTRKTRKAIKTAFMSLLTKNDLSKITIKDISDLADINRKTFYAHYNDISAVSDEVENDMVNKFIELIDGYDMIKFISSPYSVFQNLTKFIAEDIEFYGRFFCEGVSGQILDKVKKTLKEMLVIRLADKTNIDSTLLNYTVGYFTAGLLNAFQEWFNSDRKISLEELSKHLSFITTNGLQAVINKF